jgi:hypothetical protein
MQNNSKLTAMELPEDELELLLTPLLKIRNEVLGLMVMLTVLGLFAAIVIAIYFSTVLISIMLVLTIPIFSFIGMNEYFKSRFRKEALPLISKDVVLRHGQKKMFYYDIFKNTLGNGPVELKYEELKELSVVQKGIDEVFQDNLHGEISGVTFCASNIRITGRKNILDSSDSRNPILFEGLIVAFDHVTNVPECVVIEKPGKLTKLFSRHSSNLDKRWPIKTDWLSSTGVEYYIYSETKDINRIKDGIGHITRDRSLGRNFYSLGVSKTNIYISLASTYYLFKVGTLFSGRKSIQKNIKRIYEDTSWMMDLLNQFPPKP